MKKYLSIMLCLALLLGLVTTAYATGNTTTVSLEVPNESYTLRIPANVEINPAEKTGTITISVEDVNLIWSDYLKVIMTAQNVGAKGERGSYLLNSESGKKIHYNISNDVVGTAHASGGRYIALDTRDSTTNTITLTVDGEYPGAGTYTDVLTFTVETATIVD